MNENKKDKPVSSRTGKYFKYAIGEIILVVIGILIALQINNWNEQIKANKQEHLLLKQLELDVNSNLDEVKELNKRLRINMSGIDSLISRLNTKKYDILFSVYLNLSLKQSGFNNASSGYKLVQNGKGSFISDETVLKSILNLYENDFPDISDRQSDMKNSIDYIQRHFVNKLFIKSQNMNIQFKAYDVVATDLFQPEDFLALSENIEFKNTIIQLGKLIETRIAYLEQTEVELSKTVTLLNSQLDQQ